MRNIITIIDPQEKFNEIDNLVKIVFEGFMATAMDYCYHINNVFGSTIDNKYAIYEMRDNIHYRLNSAKLHFYLLLRRKIDIETQFKTLLKENPKAFDGFITGNPIFELAADEIMSIYDSIIFHLSSSFDYLAMLIQFMFGENPKNNLQWITLVKHCYSQTGKYRNRVFSENIKLVDSSFVSKFNDYRAELIHRKKSTSFANVTWQIMAEKVTVDFKCSDKIKSRLKKILDINTNYCITYVIYLIIKESILSIGKVLEGINNEFRQNYNPHNPVYNNNGFQIATFNSQTRLMESPSLSYWAKFMEYKKFTIDSERL